MIDPTDYPKLSEQELRLLQTWVTAFETEWNDKRLAARLRDLPPKGNPLRLAALKELVAIDLRRHWQQGNHVRVEAYLKSLPELGTQDTISVDLIHAEFEARRHSGNKPDLNKFAQRFPYQIGELRQRIDQRGAGIVSPRPAGPKANAAVNSGPASWEQRRTPVPAWSTDTGEQPRPAPWRWIVAGASLVLLVIFGVILAVVLSSGKDKGNPDGNLQTKTDPKDKEKPRAKPVSPIKKETQAPRPDPDFQSDKTFALEKGVPAIHIREEVQVDAVGNSRSKVEIKLPPERIAHFRRVLSRPVGKGKMIPPKIDNVLRLMDLEGLRSLLEHVDGEIGADAIRINSREAGSIRHEDGRWVYLLTADPSAPYELCKKERSQIVTLRALKKMPAAQFFGEQIVTLPPGAHQIEVSKKPNQLTYHLPTPQDPADKGAGKPVMRVLAKAHILSALYKQYGNPRFPKFWAARSILRNKSGETLTHYRVRFRLGRYSSWSGWKRSDMIFPGQTVVDIFHPIIDPRPLWELQGASPVDVEAEYEYVRPNGERVKDTHTERTQILGMDEGVYSDVAFTPESTWLEAFKDAPMVLASFTSANDPVIKEVVGLIAEATGGAAPAARDADARRYLLALYNLMRGNIAYETTPGMVLDGMLHQKLKYGRDVLANKSGTCVNLSIFYASAVEAAGLEAFIIVVPGHAFAAARLPESKKIVFVETTGCGGGKLDKSLDFDTACRLATKKYQDAAKEGLLIEVNIPYLRKQGVTPPDLKPLEPGRLKEWAITMPKVQPPGEGDKAKEAATTAAQATIDNIRRSDGIRGRVRGMVIHFHMKINNAKGLPCQVVAVFGGKNGQPVRSRLRAYSTSTGCLMTRTAVTPRFDKSEWQDVQLFVPYLAIPGGPGTHQFVYLIQAVCNGKDLIANPPMDRFSLTRK